jgi:hypothetical protein
VDVTLNSANDFVINNQIAEVKSIHGDFSRAHFDQKNGLLIKSIPNSYSINDLDYDISRQLIRKKWFEHLSKAIGKQKGKIVFLNATQSPELGRLCIFIEERNLQKDIIKIIHNAIEFIDNKEVIPAVVTMEAIYNPYVTPMLLHHFYFLYLSYTRMGMQKIHINRYNKNYI